MGLLNNEECRFGDRKKIFEKKGGEAVQRDLFSEGILRLRYLMPILSLYSADRPAYLLDRDSQRLDWKKKNQLLPNYCIADRLDAIAERRKLP
jgi:hypothetical protein